MPEPKPFDAGDEASVEKQEKKRGRLKRFEADAWQKVLGTVEGRYIINCILEDMSKPFAASFHPDSTRLTDFREGERNVGNKLIARAFAQGDRQRYFNLMREEHAKRQRGEFS